VERKRLVGRLDSLRGKKTIWISASAGSGKTTLVANWLDARKMPCLWYQADEGDADIATFFSYLGIAAKHAAPRYRTPLPLLTREYLSGVATFTKHFFETLFGRLKPPFCFVIDNYQDVPADSRFHEVVRDGLGMVPDGVTAIIISRSDPPPTMSRLQVNRLLDIISTEEMGFTFEESRALITSQAREKPSDDAIKTLFRKTVGWAAGLILLTTSTALGGDLAEREDVPVEELYDYFATEVYERTDDEMRTFLLMTAFLPRVTIRVADEITGKNNSEQILFRA
jgi:ATP/maltotriose-dependent transcriptional regulator MalT